MNDKTNTFKIYYNGHLDYRATYTPVIRNWTVRKLKRALDYVDFFFVNSRWPRQGEI